MWAQSAPLAPVGPIIGVGDTLSIQALGVEDMTRDWRVNASGTLSLPLVGYIQAAGLTQEEFEATLIERLRKYVKEPQVSVFISESRSRPVIVAGAVQNPGELQVDGTATLLEMIARAGGTVTPGPTVTVTRPVDQGSIPYPGAVVDDAGEFSSVELPLTEALDGSTRAANLRIQPFDRVTVSTVQVPLPRIYIAGAVQQPGQIELVKQDTVSITTLLAIAGGWTPTAKPSETLVLHHNADGRQTGTETVDLSDIAKGKRDDFELVAGDVVIVQSSQLKTILSNTGQALVSGGLVFLGRF